MSMECFTTEKRPFIDGISFQNWPIWKTFQKNEHLKFLFVFKIVYEEIILQIIIYRANERYRTGNKQIQIHPNFVSIIYMSGRIKVNLFLVWSAVNISRL